MFFWNFTTTSILGCFIQPLIYLSVKAVTPLGVPAVTGRNQEGLGMSTVPGLNKDEKCMSAAGLYSVLQHCLAACGEGMPDLFLYSQR